ncbi:Hypp4043 [Branchiostoma lanceolatum]|uniref:Hypp4043 protein n=1 Tax=Branchiostoma lanceolatum TaxID=7740 RepID=A0A8K0A4H8_BRALA|nr:Hypp4043 [Branchiostoma lanceolatum]
MERRRSAGQLQRYLDGQKQDEGGECLFRRKPNAYSKVEQAGGIFGELFYKCGIVPNKDVMELRRDKTRRDVPARRRERSSQGTRSIGEWGYEARNRTPIITLGGYEEAIRDEVFSINEGLASRFPEMITFAPIQPVQLTIGDVHVADGIILQDPYPDTADQETSVVEVSLTEIAQTAEADTFAHEYVSTWSKDGGRFLKDCRAGERVTWDKDELKKKEPRKRGRQPKPALPAAKPGRRPAAKPALPAAKPGRRPAAKPALPAAKPGRRPAAKPALPAAKPGRRPAAKPALPAAKSARRPAAKPALPAAKPGRRPAAKPALPAAKPGRRPAAKPALPAAV